MFISHSDTIITMISRVDSPISLLVIASELVNFVGSDRHYASYNKGVKILLTSLRFDHMEPLEIPQ